MRRATFGLLLAAVLAGCTAGGPSVVHGEMRYAPPDGFIHHDLKSSAVATTWVAEENEEVAITALAINHTGTVAEGTPRNATPEEIADRYLAGRPSIDSGVRAADVAGVEISDREWYALNATLDRIRGNYSQYVYTRAGPSHIYMLQLVAPSGVAAEYYPAFRETVEAARFG